MKSTNIQKSKQRETRSCHSKILDRDIEITVHLPDSYLTYKSLRWPVLFLFDNTHHMDIASAQINTLTASNLCPEFIIVAIENKKRFFDATPSVCPQMKAHFKGAEETGGASIFLDYLEKELIPTIDTCYRTEPFRIIMGNSLTGLLTTLAFLDKPGLFHAHIASSPSLWYNKAETVKRAKELISHRKNPSWIQISLGNESTHSHRRGILDFKKLLAQHAPTVLQWSYRKFPDHHVTVPVQSLWYGLQFIFDDIQPEQASTLTALRKHYKTLSRRYGFSLRPPLSSLIQSYNWTKTIHNDKAAAALLAYGTELYPKSHKQFDQ